MLTSWQLAVLTVVWGRIKCGRIDLVRAHLIRYRTHIQHTRANTYSYPSAVLLSPRPQLLGRATLLSPARRWSQLVTHTPAARIPTCPGRLHVRADALVPPAHLRRACLRAAIYRQTSLADRHIQDTAAHDPGDKFRAPWPQKYHHARTSVGCCKGISASACQRRAHESATQPCRKPLPRSANPNPTSLRDTNSTSGRPRVGAGGLFPYPVTHKPCLVPMLGPGYA